MINPSFGRRNPHCSNCGDERGGPFGHEISECLYRRGMTAEELARTMPAEKARAYWSVIVDRYLDEQLAALSQPSNEGDNHDAG